MEASSSSRRGGTVLAGRCKGKLRSPSGGHAPVHSLGADLLCAIFSLLDHFDLIRCSAVCKSWNDIIYRSSTLMRDLYYKWNPHHCMASIPVPSEASMRAHVERLAMEEHRMALLSGSPQVHQWLGHSVRVNSCRMKRGVILTGVGDKVLRLWSAESYKCLNEYSSHNMSQLVDCDFDENKIVGLGDSSICIWRHNQQRSIFESRKDIFTHALCMSYIDPEAAIGCEDGRVRIFDLYSGSCSRIIRTLRPVWETRISPNVIYATHHLSKDRSTIAVGGLDGVLRILNQKTGEVLSSFVTESGSEPSSSNNLEVFARRRVKAISRDATIDRIPRSMRPPITCLAVGMKKIVTTHNEKYIRMWRFHE